MKGKPPTRPVSAANPYAFSADGGANTFLTGGGLPNKDKDSDDDELTKAPVKKHFKHEEDEMLDKVEGFEREMKEMLDYLNEVSDMMRGDDLSKIAKMVKYSKQSMGEHVKTIDNIRDSVYNMNAEAMESVGEMAEVDPNARDWLSKNRGKFEQ